MIGDERLVPPYWAHELLFRPVGAYTRRPVAGSATAETSAMPRLAQPVSKVLAAGSATLEVEHPEPAPLHAVSVQPRAFEVLVKDVPPTAVTYLEDAGNDPPWYPLSP